MRAVILSIGSELLQGFLTDTNATFLAQELVALGVEVVGVSQVDDNLERVVRAFERGRRDAELVVSTGGIGPTDDDLTREAISATVGEQPTVDHKVSETIREFFTRRGLTMPEQNVKQAWLIPSAEFLPNPIGTAPGWFVRHNGNIIISMPGVPREMMRMWTEQAAPRIIRHLGSDAIISRTLKTIGIGESAVEQEIIDIIRRGNPVVATYAKNDGVHIRISATAPRREDAEARVNSTESEIRERLENFIYGDLVVPLSTAILGPIARTGERIAVWEAGNAGRLSSLLGESPLAEDVVEHCVAIGFRSIASASESSPSTLAASGAREAATTAGVTFGAAVVVAIDPGPSLDQSRGEIGIALYHPGGVVVRSHSVTTNPPEIRRRATMWAADFLWSTIRDATAVHRD